MVIYDCMRWFLDHGCPFYPILETSHSGKSRNGKERNSPFCVMSSLSAATVVSSTTAGLCWLYTEHVIFTCELRFTIRLIIITTYDERFAVAFDEQKTASAGRKQIGWRVLRRGLLPLHLTSRIRRKPSPTTGVKSVKFYQGEFLIRLLNIH
ncbi:hypothetical protein EVAR_77942_1 [Eumeta japonica]|uniref:Uncharacterized protein n=1 Tax=Eumeta variegata TaxID=151549 RepID=A0A4C1XUR9_EUMVA|nr:hypothetical protein EVAR_77942_1 [Eumeta japonica]